MVKMNDIAALAYVYIPDSLVWDRLDCAQIYREQDSEPIYATIKNEGTSGNITSEFFDEIKKYTMNKTIVTAREIYGIPIGAANWVSSEYLGCSEILDISYILSEVPESATELYDQFRTMLTRFRLQDLRRIIIQSGKEIDSTGVFEFRRDTPYCTKGIYNGYRMSELPDEYYEAIVNNPKEFPEELRIIAKRALQRIYPAKTLHRAT